MGCGYNGGEEGMLMAQTVSEPVGAVVISGPRQGEVVLLDPDVVLQAAPAEELESITALNEELDRLNAVLDRFLQAVKTSADDYKAAAKRLEQAG
jgi:hypothetical protein